MSKKKKSSSGKKPPSRRKKAAKTSKAPRKHRRSRNERRNQSAEEAKKRAALDESRKKEYEELETDEERILWYARHGAEAPDIAVRLNLEARLEKDAEYRAEFERLCKVGAADQRIEIAETVMREARMGQVTSLANLAKAYLAAFKKEAPSMEFAGSYRAKVEELLEKIYDGNHKHVIAKFKFEE